MVVALGINLKIEFISVCSVGSGWKWLEVVYVRVVRGFHSISMAYALS